MKRLLVAGLMLAACTPPSNTTIRTVKLGAVIDRTGTNSEASWGDAIALAEEHMNAALTSTKYKDMQFDISVQDSQNEPTVAVQRATELVRDGAKALILDTSQNDSAVNMLQYDADTSNDLNVPLQCSGCTSGSINNPTNTNMDPVIQASNRNEQRWNFKGIMSTKLISQVIVRTLLADGTNGDVNNDGTFKLAIYVSDETFGNATATDLTNYAMMLHGENTIVEVIKHPRDADPNAYNFAADVEKMMNDRNDTTGAVDVIPDAVAMASFAQYYVAFVRAYEQAGHTQRVMNVHTFRISTVLTALGSQAENWEGISHVVLETGTSGDAFKQAYEARVGLPPNYRDAMYYDNAMTLMLATLIAAKDVDDPTTLTGAQLRDAMVKTSAAGGTVVRTGPDELKKAIDLVKAGTPINYEGAGGPMDYNENQTVKNRLARYRVQNGQYVDVETFDCVASDDCTKL